MSGGGGCTPHTLLTAAIRSRHRLRNFHRGLFSAALCVPRVAGWTMHALISRCFLWFTLAQQRWGGAACRLPTPLCETSPWACHVDRDRRPNCATVIVAPLGIKQTKKNEIIPPLGPPPSPQWCPGTGSAVHSRARQETCSRDDCNKPRARGLGKTKREAKPSVVRGEPRSFSQRCHPDPPPPHGDDLATSVGVARTFQSHLDVPMGLQVPPTHTGS